MPAVVYGSPIRPEAFSSVPAVPSLESEHPFIPPFTAARRLASMGRAIAPRNTKPDTVPNALTASFTQPQAVSWYQNQSLLATSGT